MAKAQKLPPGKKHPLRVLQRRFEMLQWITFLIPLLSYFLWWIAPDIGGLAWGRDYLILIALLTLFLYIASVVAPGLCFVQCHADYLLLSGPLFRCRISYARLLSISSVNFNTQYPLSHQKELEQALLKPLFSEQATSELTVVGVTVKKFPLARQWLQFWFGKYLFLPRAQGFLFLTPDWMGLSRELEVYRHDWRDRRLRKKGKVSPASQLISKENLYDG